MEIKYSEEDKKVIEQCTFVIQNNVISFPQGATYPIKKLQKILKDANKTKRKKDQIMVGIVLAFEHKPKKTGVRTKKKPKLSWAQVMAKGGSK